MELDAARRKIDDLKFAMEKLTEEYTAKSKLSEQLRRVHDEQFVKFKEAKKEIEKQSQELQNKSEEINLAKKMYEDLQSSLHDKESVVRRLASANDQLRNSSLENLTKLERQNRDLCCSLEEANCKVEDQGKRINSYKEELAGLKSLLSNSQKRCFEAEKQVESLKELSAREASLIDLEQAYSKIGEKLKWKNEQFNHLEQAHGKLQNQFRASKGEWGDEKACLIEEMCSLQGKLESQTRVVEDLNSRLKLCNQALAHEESQRKLLKIQISESQISYENVVTEYEEVRSKFENLMEKRDEDIAAVRNLLISKESLLKEVEFRNIQLQQHNDELQASLKEFQLAQINEVGSAAVLKDLRRKYKKLDQAHKDCLENMKSKESVWSSQVQDLENDLSLHRKKLCLEEENNHQLQLKLEDCLSSLLQLRLENDEMSVVIMIFQSRISELSSQQFEEFVLLPKSGLEVDFEKEKLNFVQELNKKDRKIEDLEKEVIQLQQLSLEQQLDIAAVIKFEAMTAFLNKERGNFQEIVREKEKIVKSLNTKLNFLEKECTRLEKENVQNVPAEQLQDIAHARLEAITPLGKEARSFQKNCIEKQKAVEELNKKRLNYIDQDSVGTNTKVAIILPEDQTSFLDIIKQKDLEIADLHKQILSQEEFTGLVETTIALRLVDMQSEIDALHKSWSTIVASHFLDMYEIEFKDTLIHELNEEQTILKMKLEAEEKRSCDANEYIGKLEHEMETQRLERKNESVQIGEEHVKKQLYGSVLENQINQLNTSLISAKEYLLAHNLEISNVLGKVCNESGELMERLERMECVENAVEQTADLGLKFKRADHP